MGKETETNKQDMNLESPKVTEEKAVSEILRNPEFALENIPNNCSIAEECNCSTTVSYCCVQKVPGFITAGLTTSAGNPRIAWDPSCLRCVVEKCRVALPCTTGVPQTVKVFVAKIVGCMPYQIETRYDASEICADPAFTNNTYSILCADSVRFNNAICFSCKKEELEDFCKDINKELSEFPDKCNIIQQEGKTATLRTCANTGGRFVEFTGRFVIRNFTCP